MCCLQRDNCKDEVKLHCIQAHIPLQVGIRSACIHGHEC
jgi:hypothetical protein